MAKPKLALIPAAQGTKLYSVLPSDGSGDFDFTRGSAATRINAQGLIETVADTTSRLNYPLLDGKVVGCPHNLLEPQRSNLITYSESFSNAFWTKSNSSIVSNNAISPDGSLNADKLIENSSNSEHRIFNGNGLSVSGSVSMSVFAKKGGRNFIRLTNNNIKGAFFDLNTGVVGNVSSGVTAKIEDFDNDWYKCSITQTGVAGERLIVYLSNNGVDTSYAGDGSSGVYLWGASLEAGSFPTSYIKSNIGSTTTRLGETANGSGSAATFNDSEGVLMTEISALANDGSYRMISLSDGTVNNSTNIQFSGVSNQIRTRVENGGAAQADISSNVTSQTLFHKIAVLYKSNKFELWSNGFKLGEDTSGTPPSGINKLSFIRADGLNDFYGNVKQVQYFDSILDSQQLAELTSWQSFSDMAEGQLYTIE